VLLAQIFQAQQNWKRKRALAYVSEEKNKLFQLEPLLWKSMADRFQKCVLLMLPYTASAAIAVHGILGKFMHIHVRFSDGS
jgi:hypothetical protein